MQSSKQACSHGAANATPENFLANFLQISIIVLSLQPWRDLLKFWLRSTLAFVTYKEIQSFPVYT